MRQVEPMTIHVSRYKRILAKQAAASRRKKKEDGDMLDHAERALAEVYICELLGHEPSLKLLFHDDGCFEYKNLPIVVLRDGEAVPVDDGVYVRMDRKEGIPNFLSAMKTFEILGYKIKGQMVQFKPKQPLRWEMCQTEAEWMNAGSQPGDNDLNVKRRAAMMAYSQEVAKKKR